MGKNQDETTWLSDDDQDLSGYFRKNFSDNFENFVSKLRLIFDDIFKASIKLILISASLSGCVSESESLIITFYGFDWSIQKGGWRSVQKF